MNNKFLLVGAAVVIGFLAGCAEDNSASSSSMEGLSEDEKMVELTKQGCERDWRFLEYESAQQCVDMHLGLLNLD